MMRTWVALWVVDVGFPEILSVDTLAELQKSGLIDDKFAVTPKGQDRLRRRKRP